MCINKVAESTAKWIIVDVAVSVELHLIFYVTYFDKLLKMFFLKLWSCEEMYLMQCFRKMVYLAVEAISEWTVPFALRTSPKTMAKKSKLRQIETVFSSTCRVPTVNTTGFNSLLLLFSTLNNFKS